MKKSGSTGVFKSTAQMRDIEEQEASKSMAFTTSHTESGEGTRGIKTALERSLDWLKEAEPGKAAVRWRLTISFKEAEADGADNESARRSAKLPGLDKNSDRSDG